MVWFTSSGIFNCEELFFSELFMTTKKNAFDNFTSLTHETEGLRDKGNFTIEQLLLQAVS